MSHLEVPLLFQIECGGANASIIPSSPVAVRMKPHGEWVRATVLEIKLGRGGVNGAARLSFVDPKRNSERLYPVHTLVNLAPVATTHQIGPGETHVCKDGTLLHANINSYAGYNFTGLFDGRHGRPGMGNDWWAYHTNPTALLQQAKQGVTGGCPVVTIKLGQNYHITKIRIYPNTSWGAPSYPSHYSVEALPTTKALAVDDAADTKADVSQQNQKSDATQQDIKTTAASPAATAVATGSATAVGSGGAAAAVSAAAEKKIPPLAMSLDDNELAKDDKKAAAEDLADDDDDGEDNLGKMLNTLAASPLPAPKAQNWIKVTSGIFETTNVVYGAYHDYPVNQRLSEIKVTVYGSTLGAIELFHTGGITRSQFWGELVQLDDANEPADQTSIFNDFKWLHNNSALSDVTFVIDKERIPGHRAVLAARSTYFRMMFTGSMEEAKASTTEVPISGVTSKIFRTILGFVYTNSAGTIRPETAYELYMAADLYSIPPLKTQIENFFENELTLKSALAMCVSGQVNPNMTPKLYSIVELILVDHFSDLMVLPEFVNLPQPVLKSILAKAKSRYFTR